MRKVAAIGAVVTALILGPGSTAGSANPWDQHYNYPPRPTGYSGIVSVFGKPCNSGAKANALYWTAADDGRSYRLNYHRKLGGMTSSNVYPDIRFHVRFDGYDSKILHGIWGYNCRYIAGTTKWSTHAWGIGIDLNSAYEHLNHRHCHTLPSAVGRIFRSHNWIWGLDWGDCMHFQYASGY